MAAPLVDTLIAGHVACFGTNGGRRSGVRPRHVRALLRRRRQIVRAAAGVGHLPCIAPIHLVRVDSLMRRDVVGFRVARGHSSAARSARNHAVNRHRPRRPNNGAIGTQRQHQRLWPSIDGDRWPPRLEIDRIHLLVRRQERAVHQHAAVNKIQPPTPCTLIRARHVRSGCSFRRRPGRGQHRREHLPKRTQQRVTGTSRRQPAGTHTPPNRTLFRILRRSHSRCSGWTLLRLHLSHHLLRGRVSRRLLLLLRCVGGSNVLSRRLLASREELLQRTPRLVCVHHRAVAWRPVRMRHLAHRPIRRVVKSASLDVLALAIAHVGQIWPEVLRRAGSRNSTQRHRAQQLGAQFQKNARVVSVLFAEIRNARAHSETP